MPAKDKAGTTPLEWNYTSRSLSPKITDILHTARRVILHNVPRITIRMCIIPDMIRSIPISDLRARMQITVMREIIPVVGSEFFVGHGLRCQDLDLDVRFFITEHGVFVESDVDFGVRFVGAVVFAAVSGIIDGDDIAPSVTGIAGMLGEVESLASMLAL
jgi:hypothetical protein